MTPSNSPALRKLRRLRQALARQVDADLAGIRLAVVPGLPVAGFAFGDLIAISSRVLQGSRANLLHTVGHELAHVFQQRAGRVRPTGRAGRVAFNLQPSLEAEAEAAAATLVRGGRLLFRSPTRARPASPVLQPLIAVGGQPCTDPAKLSPEFLRLLNLVALGPAWLDWAVRSPGPVMNFPAETSLLAGIQLGLHGTATVPFQSCGLRLAPSILLDLDQADFGNLVGCLETGQLTPAALAVLSSRGICTETDFAQLTTTLSGLGVSAALALAEPTLAQQVNLHARFVAGQIAASPETVAAAGFAAGVAQDADEFSAAFAFYQSVGDAVDTALPSTVWTALSPLTFPYLNCPVVDPNASDDAVSKQLFTVVRQSGFVGFGSAPAALANFAAHAGFSFGANWSAAGGADQIRVYMQKLGGVVLPPASTPVTPKFTRLQDGVTRRIDFDGSAGRARFQLDPSGLLTLREFVPAA